jgi:two-component system LytT family sensor kinase
MQFYISKQELNLKIMNLHIKKVLLAPVALLATALIGFCQTTVTQQPIKNKSHTKADTPVLNNNEPLFGGVFYYGLPFERNLGIRFINNGKTKSEVYQGLRWNQSSLSNSVRSIIIDGDCDVEFSCLDINEKNAGDYRYRVVKNSNEGLASWVKPSVFIYSRDKKFQYAYLGHFNYAPNQVLKMEIYNVKNNFLKDAMLIGWRKLEPATVRGFIQFTSREPHFLDDGLVSVEMDRLGKTKEKYEKQVNGKPAIFERPYKNDFIETTSLKDIKFRLADSLQNLHFYISVNFARLYNYTVILKREVKGRTESINLGETNTLNETETLYDLDNFDLNKSVWNNPGKYKLTFIPKIIKMGDQPSQRVPDFSTSFSFTVLPSKNESVRVSVKTLIFLAVVIIFIAIIIFVYYIRQKVLLAKETQNRKTATLQLQSIRSQLNPHFIFNALAGIQNLMNKNEVENANKYLTRFARLTRNVLDDDQKELTSIEHEIDLLTDYLQMEQMRFGFTFNINIDNNDIDQQIEIPAMLLQPFVENAVKHGVSSLKDKGVITINIIKKDNNLILTVQDNGKGFSEDQPAGMGFKLCEDRIKLLNSIYKNTFILLHKKSDSNGTLIAIELNSWL